MVLPAPLPPCRCVTRWLNPLTPRTGPSAGRGTEASARRARGRAATSYNWQRLRDFHKVPENALVFGQFGAAGLELGEKAAHSDLGGRTGVGGGNQRMTELAVGTALPDELAAYAGARDVGLPGFI